MGLIFRKANVTDISGIVRLNRKIVDKWRHVSVNQKKGENFVEFGVESPVDELSPFELWYHGGYWNDETLFKFFFQNLIKIPGNIWICENSMGEILGEVDYCWDESTKDHSKAARLLWIVTDPDHRRSGIATRLIDESLNHFAQRSITQITVWSDDESSHAFYVSMGFKPQSKFLELEYRPKNTPIFSENLHTTEITDEQLCHMVTPKWSQIFGNVNLANFDLHWILISQDFFDVLGMDLSTVGFHGPAYLIEAEDFKMVFVNSFGTKAWINTDLSKLTPYFADILHIITLKTKAMKVHTKILGCFQPSKVHILKHPDIYSEEKGLNLVKTL